MMRFNTNLYLELDRVRQRLKSQGRVSEGRAPSVCSDEALLEIIKLMPQSESELLCVPGLGQKFVDKYASAFLPVIKRHAALTAPKGQKISSGARHTLKELEKKLVNINRRNRLLYMAKISQKHACDLFDPDGAYNPLDILFGGKTIKICDLSAKGSQKGKAAEKYKRLVSLIREVNRIQRDKGQYDLYIGYPFVKGRLIGEDFNISAPLALFPVEVSREADHITLSIDENRDVVYNNHLVLAHYMFNHINRPLPNNVIEDLAHSTFLDNLIAYYGGEGINLIRSDQALFKFQDYLADAFPLYENGEMYIDENAVLGNFPTFASSLQKDFNSILEQDEISKLLAELLTAVDDLDSFDYYAGDTEVKDNDVPLTLSEHNLTYIGELNGAQENVITAIKVKDALVVEGPPGTGKSQTITSLIADYVHDAGGASRKVLLISEKKAALDVVYSRLGELNRYALHIDDTNNKKNFYEQMEKLFYASITNASPMDDVKSVADRIDEHVKQLEVIAQKLYTANEFGIEAYKLYQRNVRLDSKKPLDVEKIKVFKGLECPRVLSYKFKALSQLYETFNNEKLASQLMFHTTCIADAAWLNYTRTDLSEFELGCLSDALLSVDELNAQWKQQSFYKRLLQVFNHIAMARSIFKEYFVRHYGRLYGTFLKGNLKAEDVGRYSEFVLAKAVFSKLNNEERLYLEKLKQTSQKFKLNYIEANKELYNYLIWRYIDRFEASNREVLGYINDFPEVISSLSIAISKKRGLTKQLLSNLLYQELFNITASKRQGEIARVIHSKRRWSIKKFIDKFSFELFKGIKIWLLTPEVASEILPLQSGLFDLVVFDEASQMFIEKGIPAIARAKKVVIAGDSKQLRPSNLGQGRIELEDEDLVDTEDVAAALEEESLLDLARFRYVPPILLNYHYRSRYEELIAFSNYAFYKGKLYVSPNVKPAPSPPIDVIKVEDGLWIDRSNRSEAQSVITLLKDLFIQRTNNETIGVITFNSNQRDLIHDLIDEECKSDQSFAASIRSESSRWENGEDVSLFVKNIENVQGDERDVIIFSIGYAKNESGRLVKNYGWLNKKGGENRLNVAITRAKERVVIVTSFHPSELQVESAQNEGPKILKKYLEYAFAVSEGDKEEVKRVLMSFGDADKSDNISFDSDFENQVYDALRERGLEVQTQVGIGGYSIDLAIRKNNQYVLGIECDGKLYHSSKSARERDYHRQKYLESRGWRIHRIWSTNWWRNPSREIDKIVEIMQTLT